MAFTKEVKDLNFDIYTVKVKDLNFDIYTVNVDGTGLTRLTDHPAMDFDPVWSPIIK